MRSGHLFGNCYIVSFELEYVVNIYKYIYMYIYIIYIYIYPQTRVSSLPGLISVARVNE